jgi:hypothetical protein
MERMNQQERLAKYREGDVVRVLSMESISRDLDELRRLDGCLFMEQMSDYCGQIFRVLKVVDNFFDEYQYRMYESRTPLYILEGLICAGETDTFKHRCDRSCYLPWDERWLERP